MSALDRVFNSVIDARPVRFVRIIIGLMSLLRALEGWRIGSRVLDPATLKTPLIAGLTVPAGILIPLVSTWILSAVFFTLGFRIRISGAVLAACMFTMLLLDQQLYSNHLYLLSIEVLLLSLTGVDRQSKTVPAWPVVLLKLQLSIVYLFAAITKLTPLFLSGAVLYLNLKRDGLFALPPSMRTLPVLSVLSVVAVLTEIFLGFGLWSLKYRRAAVVVGIAFHITLTAMIVPVVAVQLFIFSVAVLALYPLYFYPMLPSSEAAHLRPIAGRD